MKIRLPRKLFVVVFLAILLLPSLNVFADQWANPQAPEYILGEASLYSHRPFVYANIIGKNVVFFGESVQIGVYANSLTVMLTIIAPDTSIVYSNTLTSNTTINFTPNAIYGTYQVDTSANGATSETWFYLQDTSGLTSLTLPYTWLWKGVQYTLDTSYVVTAELDGKQITVNWIPNFLSLNPTITVSRNDGAIQVRMIRASNI